MWLVVYFLLTLINERKNNVSWCNEAYGRTNVWKRWFWPCGYDDAFRSYDRTYRQPTLHTLLKKAWQNRELEVDLIWNSGIKVNSHQGLIAQDHYGCWSPWLLSPQGAGTVKQECYKCGSDSAFKDGHTGTTVDKTVSTYSRKGCSNGATLSRK